MSTNSHLGFLSLRSALLFSTLVFASWYGASADGQTVLEVNFNNRSGAYSEAQVEEDFGELRFTNGVDEGRTRIVTGSQAFGGSGASLRVGYPTGSFGPRLGGAQWIAEFDGVEEAFLTYRVKFGAGFDFVRGGKLPGLAGGSAPSGSAPADGVRGWSGRFMWRTRFQGDSGQPQQRVSQAISYAKHLHSGFEQDGRQEDEVFWVEPDGSESRLESDVWYTLRQRVRMNTPGVRDGIIQIWLDGRLVLDQDNIQFRNTPDLKIDRLFFSTFFGGGSTWQNSKDEVVFFDDFKVSIPRQRYVPEQYSSPNAALAASNAGDTIVLGSADWYANLFVDKPLTIRGRVNARLMAAQGNRPVIRVNGDNVRIINLEIARGISGVEALSQASRLRIYNCQFRDNFGDAIRMVDARDISVVNTDIIGNEGRGVFLNRVDQFYIFNCRSQNNGGAGFEIFSDNGFVGNCQATNNRAGAGLFFIGSNSGFENNLSTNNNGMGYILVNSQGCGFSNNSADQNSSFGLLAFGVDDSFFSRNLIERSGGVGVVFNNSNRNFLADNTVSFNSGIGAYFSPSTGGNYLRRNEYQGNAFSVGLVDQGSNSSD